MHRNVREMHFVDSSIALCRVQILSILFLSSLNSHSAYLSTDFLQSEMKVPCWIDNYYTKVCMQLNLEQRSEVDIRTLSQISCG